VLFRSLLKGKLNAISAVLKLGHEAFEKHTLQQLANHIVNNSRMVAPYERSALIDMRGAGARSRNRSAMSRP
jgi:hypothetical protein